MPPLGEVLPRRYGSRPAMRAERDEVSSIRQDEISTIPQKRAVGFFWPVSTIEQKIRAATAAKGLTVAALLRKAKVGPSFLKDLKANPSQRPRVDTLGRIASVLEVPLEQLIGERKPASATTTIDFPPEPIRIGQLRKSGHDAEDVRVAELDIRLSAGPGAIVSGIGPADVRRYWTLPRSFVQTLSLDEEHMAFVEVVGNSMYPTLWPGDMVLLDLRANQPGGAKNIYAAWDSDATVCKRLEPIPDPPRLRFISDNPDVPAYEIPEEWTRVIGRVVWFARQI
ncbi:MAG TPA: S24 family peptidase [Caulobacterales bacterium]|nr:S24 family peptidase [Caulobacterales bacterium]